VARAVHTLEKPPRQRGAQFWVTVMWKIKAGIAVVITLGAFAVLAMIDDSYANRGVRSGAQLLAGVGSLLAVWIAFKALVFGVDDD